MRSITAAVTATALLATAGAAASAAATPAAGHTAAAAVTDSAVFNNPADPALQNKITDHLTSLISQAPAGSLIRIALYQNELETFTAALNAAHTRGVNVRVILDNRTTQMNPPGGGWIDNPAYLKLADPSQGLGTDKTARSWVMTCVVNAACIAVGDRSYLHNKFFLFSETGGANDVVVQSSANLTRGQQVNGWNNALTLTGNTALYDGYGSYFDDLASKIKNSDYYRSVPAGDAKAYFFPRAKTPGASDSDPATDTIYNFLGYVDCSAGTRIRVGMYLFHRSALARRLWDLDNKGCDVKVTYGSISQYSAEGFAKPGGAHGGPQVRNSNSTYGDLDGTRHPMYVHSKYLLIDGTYYGTPGKKLIFTGSHNYTIAALRQVDEAIIRLHHPQIYDQYNANFSQVWSNSPTTLRRNKDGKLLTGPELPESATRTPDGP